MRQETAPAEPPGSRRIWAHPAIATLYALAVLLTGAAALRAVVRTHADRMSLRTGAAEWIWYSYAPAQPQAVRFYATREIVLPDAPSGATAKVFVDREHVLYVNGERVGGAVQRPGDPLRLYQIAARMKAGINSIAIEASSATGVGGILFSLDVDGFGRDALVSNGSWRVDLASGAVTQGARYRPVVWGRPPQYPWSYPRMPRPAEMAVESKP